MSDTDIIHRDSWLTNDIITLSLYHVQRCVWKIPFMGKRQGTHWQEKAKNSGQSSLFVVVGCCEAYNVTLSSMAHTQEKIGTFTAYFCF